MLHACSVGGSVPLAPTYVSEFVQARYRGTYLAVLGIAWVIGGYLCGGMAWATLPEKSISFQLGTLSVHSWRVFLFICGIPSFVAAVLCFCLPESPRYLLEASYHSFNYVYDYVLG